MFVSLRIFVLGVLFLIHFMKIHASSQIIQFVDCLQVIYFLVVHLLIFFFFCPSVSVFLCFFSATKYYRIVDMTCRVLCGKIVFTLVKASLVHCIYLKIIRKRTKIC